jgi:hypothetical protein
MHLKHLVYILLSIQLVLVACVIFIPNLYLLGVATINAALTGFFGRNLVIENMAVTELCLQVAKLKSDVELLGMAVGVKR